jgi:prepilin-type N-terminal cleavage/methylation domain-containing protein
MSKLLRRRRQQGFTLIELLIVIAIIGIIAALLIPNFLDALHKAKQKRTMGDIKDMGTAWFSWMTDQFGAAAAAGTQTAISMAATYDRANLISDLQPQYIQEIKEKDAWGHTIDYCRPDTVQATLERTAGQSALGIISQARDAGQTYNCGGSVPPGPFEPTDYDQDIVWSDGFFIRYPQKS